MISAADLLEFVGRPSIFSLVRSSSRGMKRAVGESWERSRGVTSCQLAGKSVIVICGSCGAAKERFSAPQPLPRSLLAHGGRMRRRGEGAHRAV
jgi:hypothetical protein